MRISPFIAATALVLAACGATDPGSAPEPPPDVDQPDGGPGWSFLASFDASIGQTPLVITDESDLVTLWSGLGGGEPPPVDFEQVVVLAVEIGHSGSCPDTRLDNVAVDDASVTFVVTHLAGPNAACTDDYHPRTYVAAVDRSVLPGPPFLLGSADAPDLAVEVTDDLR